MTTRSTELLRVVHARPGVTRADAARLLGVSRDTLRYRMDKFGLGE